MHKKIKIKYKKKDQRYFIDYTRVKEVEVNQARYEVLEFINSKEDMMIMLDASFFLGENNQDASDFNSEEGQKKLLKLLDQEELRYSTFYRNRDVDRKLFGVPMGKSIKVEDMLVIIYQPQNTLNRHLFDEVLSTYDYLIGINMKTPVDDILSKFRLGQCQRPAESDNYTYDLVESHFMKQFYTSYPMS